MFSSLILVQGPEYAAFIYNVEHGLQLVSASLLSIQSNNGSSFCTKPYLGYFKVITKHPKYRHLGYVMSLSMSNDLFMFPILV